MRHSSRVGGVLVSSCLTSGILIYDSPSVLVLSSEPFCPPTCGRIDHLHKYYVSFTRHLDSYFMWLIVILVSEILVGIKFGLIPLLVFLVVNMFITIPLLTLHYSKKQTWKQRIITFKTNTITPTIYCHNKNTCKIKNVQVCLQTGKNKH